MTLRWKTIPLRNKKYDSRWKRLIYSVPLKPNNILQEANDVINKFFK